MGGKEGEIRDGCRVSAWATGGAVHHSGEPEGGGGKKVIIQFGMFGFEV